MLKNPDQAEEDEIEEEALPQEHPLSKELHATGLYNHSGVAILIEGSKFSDAPARLLNRRAIESYCDWFTVMGDIRSGLFKSRREFHEAVLGKSQYPLRDGEVSLWPIELRLCINLTGPLREGDESSDGGVLRERTPVTASQIDTFEVEYKTHKNEDRVIPVLTLETLFSRKSPKKRK